MNMIRPGYTSIISLLLLLPLGVALSAALLLPETAPAGLEAVVEQYIDNSGVSNPVTAVLLNFRSYDTLLEIGVLLVALLSIGATLHHFRLSFNLITLRDNSIFRGAASFLSVAMVVVAGYLLWVGGHAPGGAFQAGAVLAGLAVMLWLSGYDFSAWYTRNMQQFIVVIGLLTFILAGIGMVFTQRNFLEFHPYWAKYIILTIEFACTISIGAMLFGMFHKGRLSADTNNTNSRKGAENGNH